MLLTEQIKTLNRRLIEHYGIDSTSGEPIWRIVWSEDQYEKRMTEFSDDGFQLLVPEVRELPKYKQWVHQKYVLERLVVVPEGTDLISKTSYEPLHVFQDAKGAYLPPKWEAAKFIVDCVYSAQGKSNLAKYIDPELTPDSARQFQEDNVKKIEEELFGNETEVGDALRYREGVTDFNPKVKFEN